MHKMRFVVKLCSIQTMNCPACDLICTLSLLGLPIHVLIEYLYIFLWWLKFKHLKIEVTSVNVRCPLRVYNLFSAKSTSTQPIVPATIL